jgi:hypothetical protein
MITARNSVTALLAAAAFATAGCGEKDEPATGAGADGPRPAEEWAGPPTNLGKLEVEAFNAHAGDVVERWERSALLTAAEFVRLDRARAATTSVVARAAPEDGPTARVVVTLDGLADDSVRATRYVLELEREGGTWRLTSATRDQRCHEGRGHADFATTTCV